VRVFLAGIMQGSRAGTGIAAQDYRGELTRILRQHLDGVEIVDPLALHPASVEYSYDDGKQTLLSLAAEAAQSDALIAYLPEASMGTAIEIWQAYVNRRVIFTISSLSGNWVVRFLSNRVFADLEQFAQFVASGEFKRAVESR